MEPGRGRGQDVDALVQVAVGGCGADRVVGRQARHTARIEEPPQDQDRLGDGGQSTATGSGATAGTFTGQKPSQGAHGGLPDREHTGVADRIVHAGPRWWSRSLVGPT